MSPPAPACAALARSAPPRAGEGTPALFSLYELLATQRTLTAVDLFAERHASAAAPAEARTYRDLIPFEKPRPGQQYAFEVDLDSCTGCKACVSACHTMNGLDRDETWRTVGLLHGGSAGASALQSVTSSCHHCVDPACMRGCPTQAYEKDPVTGIVVHLDDQCFGCQYCTLMCPYDAPKYSPSRGIVRKCDMCSGRLAHGEEPACVQGCPNGAISIVVVDRAEAAAEGRAGAFIAGAPTPADTLPTTRYLSRRGLPENLVPADHHVVRPEPAHVPLAAMLTMTQLSVGALGVGILIDRGSLSAPDRLAQVSFACAAVLIGLVASVFHLGRPLLAWRALLGLRTSWLSREALALGLFAGLAILHAAALGLPLAPIAAPYGSALAAAAPALGIAAALVGVTGVYSSVMVYAATRRPHWSAGETALRFFGTALLLGAASALAFAPPDGPELRMSGLLWVLGGAAAFKIALELRALWHARDPNMSALTRRAQLMLGPLRTMTAARLAALAVGGLLLPIWLASGADRLGAGGLLVVVTAGEFLERVLFFRAAPASRMPGAIP